MTETGGTGAIGALFPDSKSAETRVAELKAAGFEGPWMAVVTTDGDSGEHAVAETSDGALGALGRYFTGRHLLRPMLVERGLDAREAARLDENVAPGGAVVVIAAGSRTAEARAIFEAGTACLAEHSGANVARKDSVAEESGGGEPN